MSSPRIRRYRARGARARADQSLQALQALNRDGGPSDTALPPARRAGTRPDDLPLKGGHGGQPPPRRRRPWSLRGLGPWGWAWRVGVLLVVAVLIWGGLGFLAIQNAADAANRGSTHAGRAALTPAGGSLLSTAQNTLIVGTDVDPGEVNARADSMMIMRTDPNSGRVKYLSISYDFLVTLPG